MKPHQVVYGVIFAVAGTLAYQGYPLLAVLPVAIAFMAGTTAVFAVRSMVVAHCEGSEKLSNAAALGIIDSLVGPEEGTTLPSFVSIGKGRSYLGDLYRNPLFQAVCQAVKTLGPVPCYPAYAWLARSSNVS